MFESLLVFLAGFTLFGSTFLFWLLIGLFVIDLFISEIKEKGAIAVAGLLIFLVLLQWKSNTDPLDWIVSNWWILIKSLLVYLSVGWVYSIIRFRIWGTKLGRTYKRAMEEWKDSWNNKRDLSFVEYCQENQIDQDAMNDMQEKSFQDYFDKKKVDDHYRPKNPYKKIKAYKKEGNAYRWICLWPISLLCWILGDMLKDLWKAFYARVSRMYDNVLRGGFERAAGDIEYEDG